MQMLRGLMLDDANGMVGLSGIGLSFLDSLHPACEDTDMPLRWYGRWAERGEGDAAAMDAWIVRAFTKLKARSPQHAT